jgi:DNA-binding CsgD family transcriptional regulator
MTMQPQIAAWMEQIHATTSFPGLKQVVCSLAGQLGFQYFVYRARFPSLPAAEGEVRLDTSPAAWREYCAQHGIDSSWDPLHSRAAREVTPILWSKVRELHPALFDKAKQFGLATGLTQPVHGPSGEWSAITFIKDRGGVKAEREILEAAPHCQFVTSFVHDATTRIIKRQLETSVASPVEAQPELTERESECLGLAALGKTASEIARILWISERTVGFHLTNVRRKLGVTTLRHALTKAASLRILQVAE